MSERLLKTPEIVWQHGWIPAVWNSDVDRIVGESGDTSYLDENTFLVGRRDQEMALRSAGIANAFAIGLPFAYALKMDTTPRNADPNSVLVVPALHGRYSVEDSEHIDAEYISALSNELSGLNNLTVLMNCDDIAAGRNREWEANGFHVILGGCEGDSDSMPRIVKIFKSFDIFTTNDFGSPIAYAAAAGCRLAIWGPRLSLARVGMSFGSVFYRNRVDLALSGSSWFESANEMLRDHGFCRRPIEAKQAESWGKQEIGFDSLLQPQELEKLIRSEFTRHKSTLDRLGLGSVKKKITALGRQVRLASIGLGDISGRRLLASGANLFALITMSPKSRELTSLRLGDSGAHLQVRPGTSDVENLYQHFVERELDGFDLGQPSRILDIGSYAGYSIFFLAEKFPNARIVGVEADPDNFELCTLHHADNPMVKLINKAVWAENTTVSLLAGPEGAWSNKTIPQTDEFPPVEGITLPSILEEVGWDSVDVIKMDIEGSEYDVLKTVATDISRMCSVLLVEFHHKLARKKELEALIEQITSGTNATVTEVGEFTVFDFR